MSCLFLRVAIYQYPLLCKDQRLQWFLLLLWLQRKLRISTKLHCSPRWHSDFKLKTIGNTLSPLHSIKKSAGTWQINAITTAAATSSRGACLGFYAPFCLPCASEPGGRWAWGSITNCEQNAEDSQGRAEGTALHTHVSPNLAYTCPTPSQGIWELLQQAAVQRTLLQMFSALGQWEKINFSFCISLLNFLFSDGCFETWCLGKIQQYQIFQ